MFEILFVGYGLLIMCGDLDIVIVYICVMDDVMNMVVMFDDVIV